MCFHKVRHKNICISVLMHKTLAGGGAIKNFIRWYKVEIFQQLGVILGCVFRAWLADDIYNKFTAMWHIFCKTLKTTLLKTKTANEVLILPLQAEN